MKYHKQKFLHRPELGEYGDCSRTCIACLLDLDSPEEVPHSGLHFDDAEAFAKCEADFLAAQGFKSYIVAFYNESVEAALMMTAGVNFKHPVRFTGTSKTGVHHVVVAAGGKIIHDPSLTDSGIVGPCSDGLYYIDILVPASLEIVS